MKRPLLFLFGVMIAGEWLMDLFGFPVFRGSELYERMNGRQTAVITVYGEVRSVREGRAGFSYVLGDAEAVEKGEQMAAGEILVYAKKDVPETGSRIRTTGVLSRFPAPSDPGQFDTQAYYLAQGVEFRLKEERREILPETMERGGFGKLPPALSGGLAWIKKEASDIISENAAPEDAGIFSAMLLGEKSLMEEDISDLFKNAGISHILAVSGLHVSVIGMAVLSLLKRLGAPSAVQVFLSAAFVGCYVLLSGAGASAMRAMVMFVLLILAVPLKRSYDLLSAMSAAGILILARQPLMLWQKGFQLSFLAIFSISLITPVVYEWLRYVPGFLRGLAPAVSIWLMTMPVQLMMTGTLLPFSVFTNLLVIPFAGIVLVSAMAGTLWGMAGLPGVQLLFFPGHLTVSWYRAAAETALAVPGAGLITGRPDPARTAVYYTLLLLVFLILARRQKRKWLDSPMKHTRRGNLKAGAAGMLKTIAMCLFFAALIIPLPDRRFQIISIDVGQGDCTLIRAGGCDFLIDAGSSSIEDVGRNRILPALKSLGVRRLSFVLLTHSDGDHINGAAALFEDPFLQTDCLLLSRTEAEAEELSGIIDAAEKENVPVRILSAGDSAGSGAVSFQCLYPDRESEDFFAARDPNETSLVMMLEYAGISALFTGDLGEEGEKRLMEKTDLPEITFLKTGHHGSKNSSSEAFVNTLSPAIAFISCSPENVYGHPSPETLERLEMAGCSYYCTAWDGALTAVFSDDHTVNIYGYLQERRMGDGF
ncbi:MAG: DNA internalization-related competence protein ComEC/Rec2 [Lachnospiraceae bacterium]|nr:DNA internalization-related competence protein ComEC/Rec2 [Lachnospiraceae bacterium]